MSPTMVLATESAKVFLPLPSGPQSTIAGLDLRATQIPTAASREIPTWLNAWMAWCSVAAETQRGGPIS